MCLLAGVCESQGASLPFLAQILAAGRTLPCIRKHVGLGLESRSGLENDVGTLVGPDFLLSLALCLLSPEAAAWNYALQLATPIRTGLLEDELGIMFGDSLYSGPVKETTSSFGTDEEPPSNLCKRFNS